MNHRVGYIATTVSSQPQLESHQDNTKSRRSLWQ